MNSSFVTISILVKSNLSEICLINILVNMSSQSLRSYLKLASIYGGNSNKKITDLVEMIVYGCIINKLNKELFFQILFINSLNRSCSFLFLSNLSISILIISICSSIGNKCR